MLLSRRRLNRSTLPHKQVIVNTGFADHQAARILDASLIRATMVCLLFGLCLLPFQPVLSASWNLETNIFSRIEYNDNIRLSTDNEEDVTGLALSPSLALNREQPNEVFSTLIDLDVTRYQDRPELARDEGKANINWQKNTERSQYGITSAYSQYSSLNQTIEISGITGQPVDQISKSLSPSWSYQLTETWRLGLAYTYTDVEYDEPGLPGFEAFKVINFINYQTDKFDINLIKGLSSTDSLQLILTHLQYDGSSGGLQIDESGIFTIFTTTVYPAYEKQLEYDYSEMQLGYVHNFTETRNVSIFVGKNTRDIKNSQRRHSFDQFGVEFDVGDWQTIDTTQKGDVYSISYSDNGEVSDLKLSSGQTVTSESTGGLVENTFIKAMYKNRITERLAFDLRANGEDRKADQNTGVISYSDRKRFSISPSLLYRLGKNWYISGKYIYTENKYNNDTDAASSNAIYVSMGWRDKLLF